VTSKWLLLVLLISLTSCSVPSTKRRKTYSRETSKSFEEIERINAIERYKKLRERPSRLKTIKPKKYARKKRAPKKRKIYFTDPEDQKVEVDQNLKFFCMEKRKDSRFVKNKSCESYTKSVLDKCHISYDWNDRALTQCVKSKLR